MWVAVDFDGERLQVGQSHAFRRCALSALEETVRTFTRIGVLRRRSSSQWMIGVHQLTLAEVQAPPTDTGCWLACRWTDGCYLALPFQSMSTLDQAAAWVGEQTGPCLVRLSDASVIGRRIEAGWTTIGMAIRVDRHAACSDYADAASCRASAALSHRSDSDPPLAAPSSLRSRTTSTPAKRAVGYLSSNTSL
jgi:hypothetical protein